MTTKTQLYFVEVKDGEPPTHGIITLNGDEPEAVYRRLAYLAQLSGKDYLTSLYLRSWAVINRLWVFKRSKDGEIIGLLTTEPLSSIDVLEWNTHLTPHLQIRVSPPALYINDLVVADEHRRLGVATRMVQHVVEKGERYGDGADDMYNSVYAISRVPRDKRPATTSHGLLTRFCGFGEVLRMQGYYCESHEHGFHCPICDPLREGLTCGCLGILLRWVRPEK